jgi:ElaB/YqjD/DUF883 family membrane-anchored ribosome-binding protein
MGQDPDAIRQEIEATRDRMGDTVDALGYKADVPARARESINDRVDSIRSKITGAGVTVSDATPDGEDLKQNARQAAGVAQENPLGLVIGAAAVGFLAGMLIPSTRIEDERVGPIADQVKQQAQDTGREAIEHGKQVAQDTAGIAAEKVKQAAAEVTDQAQKSAQAHADEMTDSVKQSAEVARDAASR